MFLFFILFLRFLKQNHEKQILKLDRFVRIKGSNFYLESIILIQLGEFGLVLVYCWALWIEIFCCYNLRGHFVTVLTVFEYFGCYYLHFRLKLRVILLCFICFNNLLAIGRCLVRRDLLHLQNLISFCQAKVFNYLNLVVYC